MWYTNIWIITVLIVLIFIVIKFKELRHKFSFLFIVFLLLLLVFSLSVAYSGTNVDLSTFDGIVSAGKIYFSFLGGIFDKTKSVTGYAIKEYSGVADDSNVKNITKKK
jgi:ABC-type polysaccharide/polyol phosphate export permease